MILEKYQIHDKVELVTEEDCILIRPIAKPRQNWEKAFAEMHKNGDDKLLIDSILEEMLLD